MDHSQSRLPAALSAIGEGARLDRRGFLRGFAVAGALASLGLQSCALEPSEAGSLSLPLPTPTPRLRAAFSHNGLKTIWNQRGRDTAHFLGALLGIDVVSYDGELSVDKQRRDLEEIADQDWDFVVIHPLAVNAYTEQVRAMVARGTPVIDIDTRLADDLDRLGVVTFLEPDNVWMAEQVTEAIIAAVPDGRFEMIHTQGLLTHTGAQGRAEGFRKVIARHPEVTVIDERAANWDIDKVTSIWDELLEQHPNVRAGFLHNDEMALAALRSISRAQRQIMVGGIDGMQPACSAVASGELVATAVNPTGRIHGGALWVGYFLATRGQHSDVPRFIRIDGGVVNRENAAGYLWQGDNLLI